MDPQLEDQHGGPQHDVGDGRRACRNTEESIVNEALNTEDESIIVSALKRGKLFKIYRTAMFGLSRLYMGSISGLRLYLEGYLSVS